MNIHKHCATLLVFAVVLCIFACRLLYNSSFSSCYPSWHLRLRILLQELQALPRWLCLFVYEIVSWSVAVHTFFFWVLMLVVRLVAVRHAACSMSISFSFESSHRYSLNIQWVLHNLFHFSRPVRLCGRLRRQVRMMAGIGKNFIMPYPSQCTALSWGA